MDKEPLVDEGQLVDIDLNAGNTSDGSSDSDDDVPSCIICYYKIREDQPYAIMKDDIEANKKYHVECLERWLAQSKKGILTRNSVDSYSIYQSGQLISEETFRDPPNQHIIHIPPFQNLYQWMDNEDDFQREPTTVVVEPIDDSIEDTRKKCRYISLIIFVVVVIVLLFFILFT